MLRKIADVAARDRSEPGSVDVRYVCESCGTKWFVRAGPSDVPQVPDCAACGGALKHLGPVPGDRNAALGREDDFPADAPV
jgi:hypothetical protein